jgi:hypothetical protein
MIEEHYVCTYDLFAAIPSFSGAFARAESKTAAGFMPSTCFIARLAYLQTQKTRGGKSHTRVIG